jgi:hypothetical protein
MKTGRGGIREYEVLLVSLRWCWWLTCWRYVASATREYEVSLMVLGFTRTMPIMAATSVRMAIRTVKACTWEDRSCNWQTYSPSTDTPRSYTRILHSILMPFWKAMNLYLSPCSSEEPPPSQHPLGLPQPLHLLLPCSGSIDSSCEHISWRQNGCWCLWSFLFVTGDN